MCSNTSELLNGLNFKISYKNQHDASFVKFLGYLDLFQTCFRVRMAQNLPKIQ